MLKLQLYRISKEKLKIYPELWWAYIRLYISVIRCKYAEFLYRLVKKGSLGRLIVTILTGPEEIINLIKEYVKLYKEGILNIHQMLIYLTVIVLILFRAIN